MTTAWDLIGFDGPGQVRLAGGWALYDTVWFNDDQPGGQVGLARLDVGPRGPRPVVRYVDPDTELVVVPVEEAA